MKTRLNLTKKVETIQATLAIRTGCPNYKDTNSENLLIGSDNFKVENMLGEKTLKKSVIQ